MAIEYVIVAFPTNRLAYIDGDKSGSTNDKLRVDTGTHTFDLGSYANYDPPSQTVTVQGTNVHDPMEITFTKKAG